MNGIKEKVITGYQDRFGHPPNMLSRAPGRVNLIGEHTDYNLGFVLPMAMDRAVWVAFSPRSDRTCQLVSLNFDGEQYIGLDAPDQNGPSWGKYAQGVAWALEQKGLELNGFDAVIGSDIPVGSGLSSSAALEVALILAFLAIAKVEMSCMEMAALGQQAEREWVGVNCGIMDQAISVCAQPGQAMLLDCRSLKRTMVPLPRDCRIVVMDTEHPRSLAESAYNNRRASCESAANKLGKESLRDVLAEELESNQSLLTKVEYMRARHVITENNRTLEAVKALSSGNQKLFGRLMNHSHESLKMDYEVSGEALDRMVGIAKNAPGCLGARMTGAGFGGCAVALVKADTVEQFNHEVTSKYYGEGVKDAPIYTCEPSQGAAWKYLPE